MKRNQNLSENNHAITNNIVVFLIITLLFFFPFAGAQTLVYNAPSPRADGSYYSETHFKFSPVLGIVLFCLVTAFFIMGFISVYARQCAEGLLGNRSTTSIYEGNGYSRRAYATGLDPVLIDTFPTFMYSDVKGHKIGKAALECAVCLNEFEDGETLRLLPKCCHVFHPHCIDAWLAFHVTCPVCRANLIPVPGEKSDSDNVLYRDSVTESTQPTRAPEAQPHVRDVSELVIDIGIGSPEVVGVSTTTNPNRSPRLTPEKSKVKPRLSRSHSTGHSMVQSDQDRERFTLRLPEEVQKKLMRPELKKVESHMAFPSARSSRKGFRSNSFGSGRDRTNNQAYYERFNRGGRPDRWGFTVTPPFLSRNASSSSLIDGDGSNKLTSGGLLKSVKSPFHRLFGGTAKDDIGKGRLLG